MAEIAAIENKIDKAQAGGIAVSFSSGGLSFKSMAEVMEFAKLMAVADVTVPKHLRGNPGACMAVCLNAIEWKMSPFAVANKSYVVNDRISYESQLIHAVIEQRAPIVGRLRHRFEGSGPDRTCTVWAFVKDDSEALEFTSSRFADIQPKNSPLWKTKPDLQLYYNASRDWARVYFPDVILGVYSSEEVMNVQVIDDRPQIQMPKSLKVTSVATDIIDAKEVASDPSPEEPAIQIEKPKAKTKAKKEPTREVGDEPTETPSWDEPPIDGKLFAETAQSN